MDPRVFTRSRMRLAELTSALGAGILGLGLGVVAANVLREMTVSILVIGAALHVWGMVDKHRIEARSDQVHVWWESAAYWLCWGALLALGIYVFTTRVWP